MERTAHGGVDLLAAKANDFGCILSRLAAQFVRVARIVRQTANHVPQFVQEDRYLRDERVSNIRTGSKVAPPRWAKRTVKVFLPPHECDRNSRTSCGPLASMMNFKDPKVAAAFGSTS